MNISQSKVVKTQAEVMEEIRLEKIADEQKAKEKELQNEESKNQKDPQGFTKPVDGRSKDCKHGITTKCINCFGEKVTEDSAKKCVCKKGQKCVLCLGVTKDNMQDVEPTCQHAKNQKCPNCIDEKSKLQGGTLAKHVPFDGHISNELKKCTHRIDAKCNHCNFDFSFNYKVDMKCK